MKLREAFNRPLWFINNIVNKIFYFTGEYIKFLLFTLITLVFISQVFQQISKNSKYMHVVDKDNAKSYYCFNQECFISLKLNNVEFQRINKLHDLALHSEIKGLELLKSNTNPNDLITTKQTN